MSSVTYDMATTVSPVLSRSLSAGLTAIDVAINSRNVAMVRKLETRAQFHAMLLLKVPKWANLGTEWKQRLVVVMPRFPSPVAPPGTERLVRTLMVAYKGRDQCVPVCKVWLDGAGEALPDFSTICGHLMWNSPTS